MTLPNFVTCTFVGLALASLYGCSGLTAGQKWSENYALAEGVQANDPAIIDGNPKTAGHSQYVESSSDTIRSLSVGSESVILLPEPRSIHRVKIHSDNLQAFDLWVADVQGRWKKIKEVKSNKDPIIDLRLRQAVYATGIKIRVHRTSDDAGMRRKNVRRDRGFVVYSGNTRGLAQIGDIELYGFVTEGDAENPPADKAETEEKDELDLLMEF